MIRIIAYTLHTPHSRHLSLFPLDRIIRYVTCILWPYSKRSCILLLATQAELSVTFQKNCRLSLLLPLAAKSRLFLSLSAILIVDRFFLCLPFNLQNISESHLFSHLLSFGNRFFFRSISMCASRNSHSLLTMDIFIARLAVL